VNDEERASRPGASTTAPSGDQDGRDDQDVRVDQADPTRADRRRSIRRLLDHEEPELLPDLLEQAHRLNFRATVASPPTVVLVLIAFWRYAPHTGLVAWAACTACTAVLHLTLHRRYRRRPDAEGIDRWRRQFTWAMAVGGALWGTLPLLVVPTPEHTEYQALVAVFVVSIMAATTIFTSPLRRLFVAFQVPLTVVSATSLLLQGAVFTTVLASVVLYASAFTLVLYAQANVNAVASVRLARRNSALVEELRAERARIERAYHELRDMNEQLARQASHDALTGLANRTRFREELDRALTLAREDGTLVAVAFIDLDRFKLVNDSLGHHVGDDLLMAVTERVLRHLRPGDVLGRQGGDEFTLLLRGVDSPEHARRILDDIRVSMHHAFTIGRQELQREMSITTSIGLAFGTHPSDSADDLMRHADAAMYRAKALGRDCVELFDDSMRDALARRVDDEAELRQAFANHEIEAWLQPEVDLFTGEILGAECLARWLHPDRGVLDAGSFVPLAEDSGLLLELSRVIVASGARARGSLVGVVDPSFRIRVNVSASQLMDLGLLNAFLEHLDALGIAPSTVSLEVTETAVIHDLQAARTWLQTARDVGMTVALDDFGTGYSSLALLSQLPLDGVKIDLQFVRDLLHSPAARAVVSATVELAAGLGLQVVAEGVETEEQAEALRRAGVRRAQGYLFAPAVPAGTLRQWLVEGAPWQDRAGPDRAGPDRAGPDRAVLHASAS
jgi:diguanylate cyclase (GGDEF)-like protein